ncbi:MAG: ATP synthase F1 subunit delta [Candidatus Doudnabacteria bacterium]|nr:ATP synthase F1 subunit delta [Candidatus Doudnabacteria bacterium]
MKFTAKQYAQALYEALQATSPSDTEAVLDNFVQILATNSDLRMFDDIASEFHKQELAVKGVKQAVVTSASPINNANEQAIVEALNKIVKSKIELDKKLDPSLVGGVVVQVDDLFLDSSVKANLEELKESLSK